MYEVLFDEQSAYSVPQLTPPKYRTIFYCYLIFPVILLIAVFGVVGVESTNPTSIPFFGSYVLRQWIPGSLTIIVALLVFVYVYFTFFQKYRSQKTFLWISLSFYLVSITLVVVFIIGGELWRYQTPKRFGPIVSIIDSDTVHVSWGDKYVNSENTICVDSYVYQNDLITNVKCSDFRFEKSLSKKLIVKQINFKIIGSFHQFTTFEYQKAMNYSSKVDNFIVVSDTHNNPGFESLKSDLIVHAGDLMYDDSCGFSKALHGMNQFNQQVIIIGGNNDNEGVLTNLGIERLSRTIRINNLEFILLPMFSDRMLNDTIQNEVIAKLEEALEKAANSDAKYRFIVLHYPVFTPGSEPNPYFQQHFLEVMSKYENKVTAVLSGHHHVQNTYLHNNVYYLLTGKVSMTWSKIKDVHYENVANIFASKHFAYWRFEQSGNKLIAHSVQMAGSKILSSIEFSEVE